jgi:hypothetical protein
VRRPGFPSIYHISCSGKGAKQHPTFFYEDDPAKAVLTDRRQSSHLSGNKPVYQLRDYVNQFQQSSFVIVKRRTCENLIFLSHTQERYNETMIILSDDLRQAIQKVATCPIERGVFEGGERVGKDGLLEMDAQYLFLYRHLEPLRVYTRSVATPLRTMIDAMLEYFDNNFAQEYAEAAALISQGIITLHHLQKLYSPNQLLVEGGVGSDMRLDDKSVYVLSSWPKVEKGVLTLTLWCW